MKIKLLSNSTINRIAAGEVIERPASVVKELVENAIDAGASKINITLERAGKNLVIVSDNGCGMTKEDLELAILRHTTSKLDEDDLLNIRSFGFRGEALPSIGSVSKMSIISKHKDEARAYQIEVIGGEIKETRPAVHNIGTHIEIRDLFFATPARLKFLRSDKTESAACIDMVKKIALAHPHVSFSLIHDGKTIFTLQKQQKDDKYNRVIEILGKEFAENSAQVCLDRDNHSILGYVSLPTYNRATSEDQFLYINNRPVKDKVLYSSLKAAYQDFLARDRHPVVALFLNIDPQLVDVNVHPAKSEVRFHDPNLIRGLLISAIKNALAVHSHKVSSHTSTIALNYFKPEISNQRIEQDRISNLYETNSKDFKSLPQGSKSYIKTSSETLYTRENPKTTLWQEQELEPQVKKSIVHNSDQPEVSFSSFPLGAAIAQIYKTYILAQTSESFIIVDQHAAHERLGYEKIKQYIEQNGLTKQRLLIPEIVELPNEKRADQLYSKQNDLANLGMTIEKFGDKSIIVTEVPALIGDVNIQQLVLDLADHIAEYGENISLIELIESVTETYACHYSIRAGKELSIIEMNELLRQMEQTPFSGQCNHGRPTYVKLDLKDIEKLFGRR